jgi:4-diphosphocytidyl-2-C-methyl-D-erythritol kinase
VFIFCPSIVQNRERGNFQDVAELLADDVFPFSKIPLKADADSQKQPPDPMRFLAPAKVNLSLRVLGRRADGFHELESLMVRVSVFDIVEIARNSSGGMVFSCDVPDVPADDSNLVVRAARLFCATTGVAPDLKIHLQKTIPHGGGLGGGSSDAACTLLALNTIFGLGLSRDALASLGAQIGSDVPFFIHETNARISGRGEVVTPLASFGKLSLLLVKPPFGVPTPWAYEHWSRSAQLPGAHYAPQSVGELVLENDLERPVFEKFLFLADLKQWLLNQPEVDGALLSGSGATVFSVLKTGANAKELAERIAIEFGSEIWTCQCHTLV